MIISKLSYAWKWCKVHWKFVLGITIPVVISILVRNGNEKKIIKKALEVRNKELEADNKSTKQELNAKLDAQKKYNDSVQAINKRHADKISDIEKKEKETLDSIDSADKATAAIKEKLGE